MPRLHPADAPSHVSGSDPEGPDPSLQRRSPHWPAVERAWLRQNPDCAVCGSTEDLNVHHIVPVHIDDRWELDERNLITLCRADHLHFGHHGNWSDWNPFVASDAKAVRIGGPHLSGT